MALLSKRVMLVSVVVLQIAQLMVNIRKFDNKKGASVQPKEQQPLVKEDGPPPQLVQTSSVKSASDTESLLKLVQSVNARKIWRAEAEDHAVAVTFQHDGKEYNYEASPRNVYSEGAVVMLGNESVPARRSPTFATRKDGAWASLTWENGNVHGLFEDAGRLMEVKPVSQYHDEEVASALLQQYKGEGAPHIISWVVPESLASKFIVVDGDEPATAVDDGQGVPENTTDPGPIEQEAAEFGTAANSLWGGTPWFPGCYSGDNGLNEMALAIASDQSVYRWKNNDASALQSTLETLVNEASFVYEKQMNFKLKIGYLEMETSTAKFGPCPTSVDDCEYKLDKILKAVQAGTVPTFASHQVFTACGPRFGTVGLAYVNTLCRGRFATGSNKIHTASPWLTFAHELGHNLNGAHSFELGQGRTGGVMDYGDGKLNGHYQFNTRFRKRDMCSTLNSKVNRCSGKFGASTSSPSPSSPSPPPPATGARVTEQGCTCRKNWALQNGGSCSNYCCNPDRSPRDWCFHEGSCRTSQSNWGYCQ